jgi:peroxiredoxin
MLKNNFMKLFLSLIILSSIFLLFGKTFFLGSIDSVDREKMSTEKLDKDTVIYNELFTDDIMVKDSLGNPINLRNIEITKDTVLIFVWCKTCGSCIHYLNFYKNKNRYTNYQILAVTINRSDTIENEKAIINKHSWPFQIFFDKEQNFAKFVIRNGFFSNFKRTEKQNHEAFHSFPQVFMFVKNKFFCYSCDKYANPFSN